MSTDELMNQTPESLQRAMQLIADGDLDGAIAILDAGILEIKENCGDWLGTAHCLQALCQKELGRHKDAIETANKGKDCGLNELGLMFYYDVVVQSLNQLDDLPNALEKADEAIAHFSTTARKEDEADHLFRKANILKQMASPLSKDPEKAEEARKLIIEAARAICKSISITALDRESIENELKYISRIAARVGVDRERLSFLDEMPEIKDIIDPYFKEKSMSKSTATESMNMAHEAIARNDRDTAIKYYERALENCSVEEPNDRALKGYILYQYGVCLLKMHDLEGADPEEIDTDALQTVDRIRELWDEALKLFLSLSDDDIADYERGTSAIRHATYNISIEPLMVFSGEEPPGDEYVRMIITEAIKIREKGETGRTIALLKRVVDRAQNPVAKMNSAIAIFDVYFTDILNGNKPSAGSHEFVEMRKFLGIALGIFDQLRPSMQKHFIMNQKVDVLRRILADLEMSSRDSTPDRANKIDEPSNSKPASKRGGCLGSIVGGIVISVILLLLIYFFLVH